MALNKEAKVKIVNSLSEKIGGAVSTVFVKFGKLTVADANAMRKELRGKEVGYFVSKKTLLKRALTENKISGEMPILDGQVSIAYGADMIAPAKLIAEFARRLKDKLSIIGGILSGKYVSASEMVALSMIPSREVLLGQLLNVLNAPVQGFVMSLDQISKKRS